MCTLYFEDKNIFFNWKVTENMNIFTGESLNEYRSGNIRGHEK